MAEIFIPFKKEMAATALAKRKICTSRTKIYGQIGDTFQIRLINEQNKRFNQEKNFELTAITQESMERITEFLYYPEGFMSAQECYDYITEVVGLKYEPGRILNVHWFKESD